MARTAPGSGGDTDRSEPALRVWEPQTLKAGEANYCVENLRMDSVTWSVDWNPEFARDRRIKQEVLHALRDRKTIDRLRAFADQSAREAREGLETEHIAWLSTGSKHAFLVRVWFDAGEEKLFIIIEENDLGDVGFLLLHGHECARYEDEEGRLKVEVSEEHLDPGSLGVPR